MFGIAWKHRVARKVMIELLYAEGIRWAGWYRDANLVAQWNRIMGQHNVGVFTREQRREWRLAEQRKNRPATKARPTKSGQFTDWRELERWLAL